MDLFERIVNHMDDAAQSGFDFEKYNQISQKINEEFSEIITSLQSDTTKENPEELLHALFFLNIFVQHNPKHT